MRETVLDLGSTSNTQTPCPECNGNSSPLYQNVKSIHAEIVYDILKCEMCGVAFTHPFGRPKTFYSEEEYGYERIRAQFREKKYRNKFYLKLIRMHTKNSLLEIGCMFGLLLNKLKNDLCRSKLIG